MNIGGQPTLKFLDTESTDRGSTLVPCSERAKKTNTLLNNPSQTENNSRKLRHEEKLKAEEFTSMQVRA